MADNLEMSRYIFKYKYDIEEMYVKIKMVSLSYYLIFDDHFD